MPRSRTIGANEMDTMTAPPDQDDPLRFEKTLRFLQFIHHETGHIAGKKILKPEAAVRPSSEYHPSWAIDGPDLHMFRMLARFNVEHNYLEYVLPLAAKGKQPRNEGKEDHWLVAALIIEAKDASSWTTTNYIESRPAYDDEKLPSTLEGRLIQLAEHYDGAIVVDGKEVLPYIKFSGADRKARQTFNKLYGHDVQFYSDIEHKKLLPTTFTVASGGKTQTGSRTSTFTSTAVTLEDEVKSHVMKTTTFGRTGVGKVLTMYVDSHKKRVYLYEFFLYAQEDLHNLMHKPENEFHPDMYFNSANNVVGIVRHYQTDLDPDVRPQLRQALKSIVHEKTLPHALRDRMRDMISDFDPNVKRKTPTDAVLANSRISPYVKEGLLWYLFDKAPSMSLKEAAKRILSIPKYQLEPEDWAIRDCYERVLKGLMIEPKLIFARYISPSEIGVQKSFIDKKVDEYLAMSKEHQQSKY